MIEPTTNFDISEQISPLYATIQTNTVHAVTPATGGQYLYYDEKITMGNITVNQNSSLNVGWDITVNEAGLYLIVNCIEITETTNTKAFVIEIGGVSVVGFNIGNMGYGNAQHIGYLQPNTKVRTRIGSGWTTFHLKANSRLMVARISI